MSQRPFINRQNVQYFKHDAFFLKRLIYIYIIYIQNS